MFSEIWFQTKATIQEPFHYENLGKEEQRKALK